jgi:hypothetical protein
MELKHVTNEVQSDMSIKVGSDDMDATAVDIIQFKKLLSGMDIKEPIELELLKNRLKVTQGTTIGKIPIHDPEQIPDLPALTTPDEKLSLSNGEHIRFMASAVNDGSMPIVRFVDDQQMTTVYSASRSLYYMREIITYKGGADITVPSNCWNGWKDGTLIEKHDDYIAIKRTDGDLKGLRMIVRPKDVTMPDEVLGLIPIPVSPVIVAQKDFNDALKRVLPSAESDDYIGVKSEKGQLILDVINKKKGSGIRSQCSATGAMSQLYFFASTLATIVSKTKDTEIWMQEGDKGQMLFCGSEGTIGYVIKPSKIANI